LGNTVKKKQIPPLRNKENVATNNFK